MLKARPVISNVRSNFLLISPCLFTLIESSFLSHHLIKTKCFSHSPGRLAEGKKPLLAPFSSSAIFNSRFPLGGSFGEQNLNNDKHTAPRISVESDPTALRPTNSIYVALQKAI